MSNFDLSEWLAERELTTQNLTDELNELGIPTSRRTVELWRHKTPPRWLLAVLTQRDTILELQADLNSLDNVKPQI